MSPPRTTPLDLAQRRLEAAPHVQLWTDACVLDQVGKLKMGQGTSGHAAIVRYSANRTEELVGTSYDLFDRVAQTSINRAELQAVLTGLRSLAHPSTVEVRTDSSYVRSVATYRLRPNHHLDLVEELEHLQSIHDVTYYWRSALKRDPLHLRCHALARQTAEELLTSIRSKLPNQWEIDHPRDPNAAPRVIDWSKLYADL